MYGGMESKRELKRIPIEDIEVPDVRASSEFDEETLRYLYASVGEFGVLQPPIVRPIGENKYELIAGKSRIQALIVQGESEVECIVIPATSRQAVMLHLIENLARGFVNPIATAKVLDKAIKEGYEVSEIAKALGHTEGWVKEKLMLLKLPEVYQQALETRQLSEGAIREALRLPGPMEVDKCLSAALIHGWSASVVRHYVDQRLREYEIARRASEVAKEPVHPPPPNPEELIRYDTCMLCNRTVFKESMRMLLICQDCIALDRYILDHIPDPNEAMDTVYKALDRYLRYQQYLKLKAEFEETSQEEGGNRG